MPAEAKEKALQELKRLEVMPPVSAEATVSRNYLEWLLAVPWAEAHSRELRDIKSGREDPQRGPPWPGEGQGAHPGVPGGAPPGANTKGQILCFVGPPGVGKTSLARSIARATGRKFVRLSLGGVRDEAEIRGHRRTYIGAFPGQIIQMHAQGRHQEPGVPAGRGRQDEHGLPGRPFGRPAGGAGPGTEP